MIREKTRVSARRAQMNAMEKVIDRCVDNYPDNLFSAGISKMALPSAKMDRVLQRIRIYGKDKQKENDQQPPTFNQKSKR